MTRREIGAERPLGLLYQFADQGAHEANRDERWLSPEPAKRRPGTAGVQANHLAMEIPKIWKFFQIFGNSADKPNLLAIE